MLSHAATRSIELLAAAGAERAPLAAVVWQRFGSYHLARLRGAADVLRGYGWRVVGLEVASRDEYQWRPSADTSVARRTLFADLDYTSLGAPQIRRAMARALDDLRPDAVCVNGWAVPEAVAALQWARRSGARTILMSETFESSRNPLKRAVRRWRVGRCDAAVVGGRLHARYLQDLGFDPRRIELGYDVVDNAHFGSSAPGTTPWHADVPDGRYFFANTRFLERKGIDALLRAYAIYRSRAAAATAPWQVVISGSGEMEASWKRLASSLGLAGLVYWPGFLQYEALPVAYQAAGAFVHPARNEPWGLVVNEAAAAGAPLLLGRRVGAACELLRESVNGYAFDPDNVNEFAEALSRMAGLPEPERRAMGAESRALVSAFGPQRFGDAVRRALGLGLEGGN